MSSLMSNADIEESAIVYAVTLPTLSQALAWVARFEHERLLEDRTSEQRFEYLTTQILKRYLWTSCDNEEQLKLQSRVIRLPHDPNE